MIEEETFTVTFRSGWHYMDNEWQNYSNELWPYNMDNDSPIKSTPRTEPLYNALDWRYDVPVSSLIQPRTVRQNGRTILASLGVNF